MASGTIPYMNTLRVNQLGTLSTTSDTLKFSRNNERHLLIVIGPGSGQRSIYIVGVASTGNSWYVEIGTAGTGLTFTTGTRQLTIDHNNASMMYIDFCFGGEFLSL